MSLQILLLLIGLALVVLGADFLVDGSSGIARRLGISEFVIGLTIVGIGTSMPELIVSLTGAIQGNSDISVGNVVGSNIFNVLLILGLSAFIKPIAISPGNRKRDIPLNVAISLLFILAGMSYSLFKLGNSNSISRIEGIVFLTLFATYIYYSFRWDKDNLPEKEETSEKSINVLPAILMVVGGLAGLVFGGRLFVNSAVNIAHAVHVSDKFIAITVLACGTSLPELITNVVAALKNKGQLALGNILGSNISNILLIVGSSALVTPLSLKGISWIDLGVLLASTLVLTVVSHTNEKNKLDKAEGMILIILFIAYMTWLFVKM